MRATGSQAIWEVSPVDEGAVRALAREMGLSDITARVLAARGLTDPDAARAFLEPSIQRDWLDPLRIPGMEAAAARVSTAITAGEKILVFGDFDLDGVSAAAVAARGLTGLGGRVDVMVPHRFREGYGLSDAAIELVGRNADGYRQLVVRQEGDEAAERELASIKNADLFRAPIVKPAMAEGVRCGLWLWHDFLEPAHHLPVDVERQLLPDLELAVDTEPEHELVGLRLDVDVARSELHRRGEALIHERERGLFGLHRA